MLDTKPENIFVVPDNVAPLGERVKLLDFGIAKFLDGPVRKTTVGMILGTPLYMSPEQCEGREDLNAKVDVYALGAMMYEMVAGRLPFQADTAAALMRQHMFKQAPRLREHAPKAPLGLDELIEEMLRKDPTERPPMSDIVHRLEELLPEVSGKSAPLVEGVRIPRVPRRTGVGEDLALDPLAATMGDVSRSGRTAKEQRVPSGSQSQHSQSGSGTIPETTNRRMRAPIVFGVMATLVVGLSLALLARPQRPREVSGIQPPAQTSVQLPVTPPSVPPSAPVGTKPSEPVAAGIPTTATPSTDADKNKSAAAEPAVTDASDADKAGKAGRKKVGKVVKVTKVVAADKPAVAAKEPPADKPTKPVGKPGKDNSDIGVWRDP